MTGSILVRKCRHAPVLLSLIIITACASHGEQPELEQWKVDGTLAAFTDHNEEVRQLALRQLVDFEEPLLAKMVGSRSDLITQIMFSAQSSPRSIESALDAYAALGVPDKDYLPRIIGQFFTHSDWRVQCAAIRTVSVVGRTEDLDKIAEVFENKANHESVRVAALTAIAGWRPVWAQAESRGPGIDLRRIVGPFDDEHQGVRAAAARTFGAAGEAAVEYLPELLQELRTRRSARFRASALTAIVALSESTTFHLPEDDRLFIRNLYRHDPDRSLRTTALIAASVVDDLDATELLAWLDQPDWLPPSAVLKAMRFASDFAPHHLERVVPFFQDQEREIRILALGIVEAFNLAEACEEEILAVLRDNSDDPEGSVRAAALRVLSAGVRDPDIYLAEVIELIKDPTSNQITIRNAAVEVFWENETAARKHLSALQDLLDSGNPIVTAKAIELIGHNENVAVEQLGRFAPLLARTDDDGAVRSAVVRAIEKSDQLNSFLSSIVNLLKADDPADPRGLVRSEAVRALGRSDAFYLFLPNILPLLHSSDEDVRESVRSVLQENGIRDDSDLLAILSPLYRRHVSSAEIPANRFLAFYCGGGSPTSRIALRLLRYGDREEVEGFTDDELRSGFLLFSSQVFFPESRLEALLITAPLKPASQAVAEGNLRRNVTDLASILLGKIKWTVRDSEVLSSLQRRLPEELPQLRLEMAERVDVTTLGRFTQEMARVTAELEKEDAGFRAWFLRWVGYWRVFLPVILFVVGCAAVAWLVNKYPDSRLAQVIINLHPWVGSFLNRWYARLVITLIPAVRHRLVEPYRRSLEAAGNLDEFKSEAFFSREFVTDRGRAVVLADEQLIEIVGPTLVRGHACFGKTTLLRRLASRSSRVVVFLEADSCRRGVVASIQRKLSGPACEERYINELILQNDLEIYIDNLETLQAPEREEILAFVEKFPEAKIVVACRTGECEEVKLTEEFTIRGFEAEETEEFLLWLEPSVRGEGAVSRAAYRDSCRRFVDTIGEHDVDSESRFHDPRLLNPLDLSHLAQMVASGEESPDWRQVQDFQFSRMRDDFRYNRTRPFPAERWCRMVQRMLEEGRYRIFTKDFEEELRYLKRHRIVVRHWLNGEAEWVFRHRLFLEYFATWPNSST